MQRVRYGFDTGVNRAYGASVRLPAEEVDNMFAGKGSIAGQIFFEGGGLGRKNGRMDEKKVYRFNIEVQSLPSAIGA